MIDAKYFREKISEEGKAQEEALDKWLKDVVLPVAMVDGELRGQGFKKPKGFNNIKDSLECRGFKVTTYSGHDGDFIYLSLQVIVDRS